MHQGPAIQRAMGRREWGLLVALSLLWGGSFFFVGVAVRALPPLVLVLARVGLAAAALLGFMLVIGERLPRGRLLWGSFLLMGLLNNVVPYSLIAWGQTHIASGLTSILNATTPLFTVVVAHLLTADEKLTSGRLAGLAAGFGGVVVLIDPGALRGVGTHLAAQLAVLIAAMSYALAGVFGRRFARLGTTPLATAFGQVASSALVLLPLVLVVDQPWRLTPPGWPALLAVLALALVSTALAFVLYFRLLARAGATNLLLVTFLIPVSAIVLGVAFLDETLAGRQLVGMALIGLGLAAIDGRPLRLLKKGPPHVELRFRRRRARLLS